MLVYVGAVMVLFLFVVMMLDINLARLREGFWSYLPLGAVVAVLLVVEMGFVLDVRAGPRRRRRPRRALPAGYSNTKELGRLIYTEYVYPFEIAAVILLVAIVAAIALTLRRRKETKYVDPAQQIAVRRQDRVRIVSMPSEKPDQGLGARIRESRRRRPAPDPDPASKRGDLISLSHYLVLGAILFAIAVIGIFLNRKNMIVLLMAIELMLLAVNMNFVAFSHFLDDPSGQVFVFFILTVAAAESAIGLAILVVLFRNLNTIDVEDLDSLKG